MATRDVIVLLDSGTGKAGGTLGKLCHAAVTGLGHEVASVITDRMGRVGL